MIALKEVQLLRGVTHIRVYTYINYTVQPMHENYFNFTLFSSNLNKLNFGINIIIL